MEREIAAAVAWLCSEAPRVGYGELGIKLIIHNGSVARSERTISVTRLSYNECTDERKDR